MVDQVRLAAEITSKLDEESYKTLGASAQLLKRYMRIPLKAILEKTRLPKDRVEHARDVLTKFRLWVKEGVGYRLTILGLDTLALHTLFGRGIIVGVGPIIAMGKESDVYEATNALGKPLALKLFRLGRTSFRDISRKRGYGAEAGHKWLTSSIESARREELVLKRLERKGLNVPVCLGRAYHVLVMEMKLGIPLYKVKKLNDADMILKKILVSVREVYLIGRMVNCDLSEFNVLITPEHEIVLIDWPQALSADAKDAVGFLKRDLHYIAEYFSKRFGVGIDEEEALSYCMGRSDRLNILHLV